LGQEHADSPAEGAQEQAVGGQSDEAHPRTIADGLDADDEVADGPADERAVLEELAGDGPLGGELVAEDAEQQPAEEPAEGPEDGVEVDAGDEGHQSWLARGVRGPGGRTGVGARAS